MAARGGVILVLVAHSGRTLQLDVQPSTRVDAVQHALVQFTGIPVADQIAMYQGARLDATKLLGAYRLPVDPSVAALEDHPVFLYCRSYLKPGAALPPQEALPPLTVQVPPLAEVALAHPLHSAASPLVRALPDYERHFQHHLATTRAYWEVAQARLQRCRQLLSEQEVQARAADAARANVEAHYGHILNSFNTFVEKYRAQAAAHAQLLATFPSDMAALEAVELHPALQALPPAAPVAPHGLPQPQPGATLQQLSQSVAGGGGGQMQPGAASAVGLAPAAALAGSSPAIAAGGADSAGMAAAPAAAAGPRRLSDLLPVARLREWAETCGRSHASFGAKVAELEALFGALRRDVEGLLQQAPSVDLDSLGRQLSEHEALLDEHSSMVQVLSKDLRTVRALVEDVVRQLGSAGGAGGGAGGAAGGAGMLRHGALNDAAAAMEAIHETHRNRVLPRLAQLDGQLAAFAALVEGAKVGMARDVVGQLQRISGQQSRIRDMRHKLAAFSEVLGRQEAAFGELRAVHRLPGAYRAMLAEAVRRAAWHQLYVSRYLPLDLLARAGLASEPPACVAAVPQPPVPIIGVSLPDLQRFAYLDERRLSSSTSLRASASLGSALAAAAAGAAAGAAGAPPQRSQHSLPLGTSPDAAAAAHPRHQHAHPHHSHHHSHQHHSASASRLTAAGSMSQQQHSAAAFPGTVAVLDADPGPPPDPVHTLELENARLRAELANHIAAAAIRELTEAPPPAAAAAGGAARGGGEARQQGPQATGESSGAQSATLAGPQQRASSGAGAAAPAPQGASPAGRRDPAEFVAAMQRALGMKDDLIRQQQREMDTAAARAAVLEQRIAQLEAALAGRAPLPAPWSKAEAAEAERQSGDGSSGDGAGGGASSSGSSSSGLQFRPSWSVMQADCLRTTGGAGVAAGPVATEPSAAAGALAAALAAGVSGSASSGSAVAKDPVTCSLTKQEPSGGAGAAAAGEAADAGPQARLAPSAGAIVAAPSGDSHAAGSVEQRLTAAVVHSEGLGDERAGDADTVDPQSDVRNDVRVDANGPNCDAEVEDMAAEDLPDIDEVIDGSGAWEVTSAGAPVAAGGDEESPSQSLLLQQQAAGDAALAPALALVPSGGGGTAAAGGEGLLAYRAEDEGGAGGAATVSSSGVLDGSQMQLLDPTSSGYESVGSVMSASAAGAGA
ncbi:hypothetical protein GPECTOR_20g506 [Gonium pectorale]|uniref:Ubiquitin-like domain-containing protein n=1 Tax=Gonium pectorale TaxID=33097 RepID=A0A150GIK2_GONPE|nr:hypothetical protein GPECTOR_20g506 [Gonium pectorale]|eukprot:KXZ49649.1 hypothetical protein GPECTOR_20g506 [Gonium pectorale]